MNLPNVEFERIKHNLTKQQLADMLGVSRKTLNNWQSGVSEVPAPKLVLMAKAWGCSVDYLVGMEQHSSQG